MGYVAHLQSETVRHKTRQGANMEWYAQIGWTAILSIFTLYYIATRFFTASGENGVAAREENDETNNSGTERRENVEAKPIQHADSEKMFKCDVSSEQEELLKAVVSWKRKEEMGQMATDCSEERKEIRFARWRSGSSCVLCAGDKCQMLKVVVLGDLSVIPKDQYKGPEILEAKTDEVIATPTAKVKSKGESAVPLWPDKQTPVRFGGYRKVTRSLGNLQKKKILIAPPEMPKKTLTPTNDIPVGVYRYFIG